ncbi:MAG TPA: hypothetical protein ENI33_06985 [Thermoplasmatales archaeon]|nr:hypothetical protein [Thermoplasmatales archaeon]
MRIRKKYLFYTLAIVSSIAYSLEASIDSVVLYKIIENPWVYCLSFFIVGISFTFFATLFLSIPFKNKSIGSLIDPSFKKIRILKRREIKYQIVAGLGNAVATMGYFIIVSIFIDSSVVLSFSQFVILYLLLIESLAEKNAPTLAEIQSSVMVTFGALLGSISLSGEINVDALLIVLFVINPGWVLFATYNRKLKLLKIDEKLNDSINIRFWNLTFTTIFVFAGIFILKGNIIYESIYAIKSNFSWLLAGAIITFFSVVLFVRAMGMGKASITQAVRASSIIFSLPMVFLISHFYPDFIFAGDTIMMLIKIIGIILVVLGVISFALTEVKAYIFIKAKTGHPIMELFNDIWKIKGITNVAVVAGTYDIIAKARIRTLGKGYERIIRDMEKIRGIENFEWQSILKEWEEI